MLITSIIQIECQHQRKFLTGTMLCHWTGWIKHCWCDIPSIIKQKPKLISMIKIIFKNTLSQSSDLFNCQIKYYLKIYTFDIHNYLQNHHVCLYRNVGCYPFLLRAATENANVEICHLRHVYKILILVYFIGRKCLLTVFFNK